MSPEGAEMRSPGRGDRSLGGGVYPEPVLARAPTQLCTSVFLKLDDNVPTSWARRRGGRARSRAEDNGALSSPQRAMPGR